MVDFFSALFIVLLLALLAAAAAIISLLRSNTELRARVSELISGKQSLATRHGQIFEQLVPFSRDFPYDPKSFRFIGDPVDGVVFAPDKIVFCEIKLDKARAGLTPRQRKIRDLIKARRVEWAEIGGDGGSDSNRRGD